MGRIKTLQIKRITGRLMGLHRNEFTEDFEENKQIVNRLLSVQSKKLRNIIAGYVTRLMKEGRSVKSRPFDSYEEQSY
ncbi:30S ribosomal protein S17e [Candidatus Woesearchaeota archaeon]|nr:30S ribosomal protein S17e [Candidatus Woesearchaeota archaeon]